jgi:hypothetical protein
LEWFTTQKNLRERVMGFRQVLVTSSKVDLPEWLLLEHALTWEQKNKEQKEHLKDLGQDLWQE